MPPVTLLIIGAGGRGTGYAELARQWPERCRVVGVAEPHPLRRERLAERHAIPREAVFADWRAAALRPRFADAVVITTQDAMHAEPAVAFARLGYHMLLEKPMAPTEAECARIVEAVKQTRPPIIFAVGHVLRYTRYTRLLKKMIADGAIGQLMGMQHMEPIGFWHFAHSYVRGNWRKESQSSSMLLAKSCHDLDWIKHFMDARCARVASFGRLLYFRAEHRPAGAGERCMDCAIEASCAYSARRIYLERALKGDFGWPVDVLTEDRTAAGIERALREGPYGRCAWSCDNDVVDQQTVMMEFEDGRTASFTATAFTPMQGRHTRLFGTHGMLVGDSRRIEHHDFRSQTCKVMDTEAPDGTPLAGHGGGDYGFMDAFIAAVGERDPSRILSGPEETLESHRMVFAAEASRREGRVMEVAG